MTQDQHVPTQSGGTAAAARLTPAGLSALAVVGIAGAGATEVLARCVRDTRALARCARTGLAVARWQDGETIVLRAKSIAGVPVYEISCHGGARVEHILDRLVEHGATRVSAAQFVRTVYGENIWSEVLVALQDAETPQAATVLLSQPDAWQEYATLIRKQVQAGDFATCAEQIDRILARAPIALHLTRPWHIAIAGRPNVGKSSLLNAVAGFERAIVHDRPGTTRDVVSQTISFRGWLFELHDTAGIRTTGDTLETEGIRRAIELGRRADLVWLVLDRSVPPTDEDMALLEHFPTALLVANKADLPADDRAAALLQNRQFVAVSALRSLGLDTLLEATLRVLTGNLPEIPLDSPLAFSERLVEWCEQIRQALQLGDQERALRLIDQYLLASRPPVHLLGVSPAPDY